MGNYLYVDEQRRTTRKYPPPALGPPVLSHRPDSSLSHFLQRAAGKQHKHFWYGGRRGVNRMLFEFQILFSSLFPRSYSNAGAHAAPLLISTFTPALLCSRPLHTSAQISISLPPVGGSSDPHKAFYCCQDFLALLTYQQPEELKRAQRFS